jgi:flagellar basal body-associated protein FliL
VKKSGFNWLWVVVPLSVLTLASAGGFTYMILKKREEQKSNEETADYDYADSYIDDNNGNPDDGDV